MNKSVEPLTSISGEDSTALQWANRHMEHPSLAARLSNAIGTPIDIAIKLLPRPVYRKVRGVADRAVGQALKVAVSSLHDDAGLKPKDRTYRVLTAGTGAVGGFFGVYGLPIDLAVSTTLMLRSIAEIARAQGERLDDVDARLACLEVFALGGHSEADDAAETGYYSLRTALAVPVTQASRYIARHGANSGGPALARLASAVASRFGAAVTQKTAAQVVPIVGAATGAAINLLFISHFQEMARGHFIIRRLERKYGAGLIQDAYESISRHSETETDRVNTSN